MQPILVPIFFSWVQVPLVIQVPEIATHAATQDLLESLETQDTGDIQVRDTSISMNQGLISGGHKNDFLEIIKTEASRINNRGMLVCL